MCGPPPGTRCLGPSPGPRLRGETAAASGAAPTAPPSVSGTPGAAAAAACVHSVVRKETTSETLKITILCTCDVVGTLFGPSNILTCGISLIKVAATLAL